MKSFLNLCLLVTAKAFFNTATMQSSFTHTTQRLSRPNPRKSQTLTLLPLTPSEETLLGLHNTNPPPTPLPPQHLMFPNPLDISSSKLTNDLMLARSTLKNCHSIWPTMAKVQPSARALYDSHHCGPATSVDWTFSDVASKVTSLSKSLSHLLNISPGDKVSIFAENSAFWLLADHAVMATGAASAVRGADANVEELRYVYEHSESKSVILQSPQLLKKLAESSSSGTKSNLGLSSQSHGALKSVVLLHSDGLTEEDISELATSLNLNLNIYILSALLSSPPSGE